MSADELQTLRTMGATLRDARVAASMSLADLAEQTGVSKGNLSKIEHGSNATVTTLYRICRALDLHPRYVLPDFAKP